MGLLALDQLIYYRRRTGRFSPDLTGRRASTTYVAPVGATMTELRRPGMFTLVEDGL